MSARQQQLHDFFLGGGSICPFAKAAARQRTLHYADLPAGDAGLQAVLLEAVKGFCRTFSLPGEHALVLIAPGDPEFEEGRRQSRTWQLEVIIAFMRVNFPRRSLREIQARAAVEAKIIADSQSLIYSLPVYRPPGQDRLQGVYLLAAGPQYPAHHPRHAPAFCLVLTWGKDVIAAQEKGTVVTRIRESMVERIGYLYDGECPYLEVSPPEVTLAQASDWQKTLDEFDPFGAFHPNPSTRRA